MRALLRCDDYMNARRIAAIVSSNRIRLPVTAAVVPWLNAIA